MNNQFKKVHSTSTRARYKYSLLKDKNLDENILKSDLKKIDGVLSVRVNKKAYSIIFDFDRNSVCEEIEKRLSSLNIDELLISSNNQASCLSCVSDEAPSTKGILRASSALVSERFIKNDILKASVTSAAALPMLIDGTKELFKEGLTSRVLESAAVGISIYRKDYLAANSTNAMLELGEYIEETTVHKSDDLLKELSKPNVEEAWIEKEIDGKLTEVLVKSIDIQIGDVVIVATGSTVPVD